MGAWHANWVDLILLPELVFEGYGLNDVGIGIVHAAVSIHQRVYHVLRHDGIVRQFPGDDVLDAPRRLPTHAHIGVGYLGFEGGFEFGHDAVETLHGAVEVVHHAFFNARSGRLFGHSQDGDTSICVLSSCDTGNLRRTDLDSHDKILCHNTMLIRGCSCFLSSFCR